MIFIDNFWSGVLAEYPDKVMAKPDTALCEERDRMVGFLRGDSVRCSRWLTN